jgi:hypothetical protein
LACASALTKGTVTLLLLMAGLRFIDDAVKYLVVSQVIPHSGFLGVYLVRVWLTFKLVKCHFAELAVITLCVNDWK